MRRGAFGNGGYGMTAEAGVAGSVRELQARVFEGSLRSGHRDKGQWSDSPRSVTGFVRFGHICD